MLLCTVVVCSSAGIFVWSYKFIFSEKKIKSCYKIWGHKKWPWLSTLLYSSDAWTTSWHWDTRLDAFHRKVPSVMSLLAWPNSHNDVLQTTNLLGVGSIISSRLQDWLGQVSRVDRLIFPKNILFGALGNGIGPIRHLRLQYKDVRVGKRWPVSAQLGEMHSTADRQNFCRHTRR